MSARGTVPTSYGLRFRTSSTTGAFSRWYPAATSLIRLPGVQTSTLRGCATSRSSGIDFDWLVAITFFFDNQLIHASLPNTSDQPRLVVAIGTRQRDAPLVHFHRSGNQPAEGFNVNEDFFLTESPVTLLEGAPDLDPVERIEPGDFDLESDALAAALDGSVLDRVRRSLSTR